MQIVCKLSRKGKILEDYFMVSMEKNYFISIYFDTRRQLKSGKFPVRLRVFSPNLKIQKLYPTTFEFSKDEFKAIWDNPKPDKKHEPIQRKIQSVLLRAYEVADNLRSFNFEDFEKLLFDNRGSKGLDVLHYYDKAIELYKQNNQIGTASSYSLSKKSLIDFYQRSDLPFLVITPQWLKSYERNMTERLKRSETTVGIYLRPLRAIFNTAIADKMISKDYYPFGKRKYIIPSPRSVKKALTKGELKALWNAQPENQEQAKAKAFWFFSYAANGMNFKDIAKLKYENISGDVLVFKRTKTANTKRDQSHTTVYLNDFLLSVINEYGDPQKKPGNFIFDIIGKEDNPEKGFAKINNFIRFVNQHIKNLAKTAGVNDAISTYWARHSFATNAIRNGASMEFVSEAFGHSSTNVTKGYFAGFEDEKKREFANNLMDF